jgi:hypothetical protein
VAWVFVFADALVDVFRFAEAISSSGKDEQAKQWKFVMSLSR